MNRGILIGGALLLLILVIWMFSGSSPEPIAAGRIVNGKSYSSNGAIYLIENDTKRWYINITVYKAHGSPAYTAANPADMAAIPNGADISA